MNLLADLENDPSYQRFAEQTNAERRVENLDHRIDCLLYNAPGRDPRLPFVGIVERRRRVMFDAMASRCLREQEQPCQ